VTKISTIARNAVVYAATAVAIAAFTTVATAQTARPEPQVVRPATLSQLKGEQPFRCQLLVGAGRPADVDVWVVHYRPTPVGAPRQFNNGPIPFALDVSASNPLVWTGLVDLDSDKFKEVSHGAGYFLFCHATYLGDPQIDDPAVANAISNRARSDRRILERQ